MARIYSIGFEKNSLTNGVEANSATWTTTGLTLDGVTFRTGAKSLKMVISSGASGKLQLNNSNNHKQFIRLYCFPSVLPDGNGTTFLLVADASNSIAVTRLILKANGTLVLVYSDSAGGQTQIGSASAALVGSFVNMIELSIDDTGGVGSVVIAARLNGTVFASGTVSVEATGNTGIPNGSTVLGFNLFGDNPTTGTLFFDDYAINDGSGSNQNSYPGAGALTLITPNAAGDANAWATQVGGTAGSTNNFTRVDEITPDDVTSYNGSTVLGQQDLFKCTDPAIGTDTVNCVQVMARYRNNTIDLTTAFVIQCEKTTGGTLASGTAIDPDSTTWFTCAPAGSLVLYNDPDGSAWIESTLATMQIGYKISTAHTNAIDVTNIWAYVDHTPANVTPKNASSMAMMGVGA